MRTIHQSKPCALNGRRALVAVAAVAVALTIGAAAPRIASACGGYGSKFSFSPKDIAPHAAAADPATRAWATQTLRDEGPAGLAALIARHAEREAAGAPAEELSRLEAAADAVAQQLGAIRSGLFWHTDLDAARAVAEGSSRPILSLRLLGKLTDVRSCANSRFFRTVLYADPAVTAFLRERFVMHWSTERPVPQITIDFGDGRKLVRTITGNSAHYVLDADGRVLDVLPGLYGPKPFMANLTAAANLHRDMAAAPGTRAELAAAFHTSRLAILERAWEDDLTAVGGASKRLASIRTKTEENRARRAMRVAVSKTMVELPMLDLIAPDPFAALEKATEPAVWEAIAERHADWATLSTASRAVVAEEHAAAVAGSPTATLEAVCTLFERGLALDTVRNEYQLHRQIHEWLAAAPQPDFESLNRRVYAELFAMPRTDAWLGLYDPAVYTALPAAGVVVEAPAAVEAGEPTDE